MTVHYTVMVTKRSAIAGNSHPPCSVHASQAAAVARYARCSRDPHNNTHTNTVHCQRKVIRGIKKHPSAELAFS